MGRIRVSSADLAASRRVLTNRWGEAAVTPNALALLAAVSLVRRCWRRTALEDFHHSHHPDSPSEYDNFVANVRLTRQLVPMLDREVIDFEGIRALVADAERLALPGRTAQVFCGPMWPDVVSAAVVALEVMDDMRRDIGDANTKLVYASFAVSESSAWWGCPDFDGRLRSSLDKHARELSPGEREAIIAAPDNMTEALFYRVRFYRSM